MKRPVHLPCVKWVWVECMAPWPELFFFLVSFSFSFFDGTIMLSINQPFLPLHDACVCLCVRVSVSVYPWKLCSDVRVLELGAGMSGLASLALIPGLAAKSAIAPATPMNAAAASQQIRSVIAGPRHVCITDGNPAAVALLTQNAQAAAAQCQPMVTVVTSSPGDGDDSVGVMSVLRLAWDRQADYSGWSLFDRIMMADWYAYICVSICAVFAGRYMATKTVCFTWLGLCHLSFSLTRVTFRRFPWCEQFVFQGFPYRLVACVGPVVGASWCYLHYGATQRRHDGSVSCACGAPLSFFSFFLFFFFLLPGCTTHSMI
jgi:hypothetical protein